MPNIFVNQINFEFEETPNYHDILLNSGVGTQSLAEVVQTIAHIYVNQVNIEVPVADVAADTITCIQHNEPSIEEVITGTPVPVEEPVIAVGGGTGGRIQVMGGRPWSKEELYVSQECSSSIGEQILIGEIAEAYAYNTSEIETRIRRPIYAKPRAIEILSFSPSNERTITIPVEQPIINSRQKEEEELLLLGII